MTTNHILYIPLVLLVGIILGVILGRRSVGAAEEEERRLEQRRQARRQRLREAAGKEAEADGDEP